MTFDSILSSIRQLVLNPTSNLAATSLGFAVVVIIVLILIMFALIALVPRAPRPTAEESSEADFDLDETDVDEGADEAAIGPASQRAGGLLSGVSNRQRLLIAGTLILIAVVATYVSSGTNGYCANTCHTMVDAGDTWASSPHAKTACVRCHEDSLADAVSTRTRHVIAEFTGSEGFTRRAAASSRRCLGCHQAVMSGTITSDRGVRVEHSHIVEAGTDCVRCHPTVGHSGERTTRQGTMSDCLRCHDDVQALAACFVCHEGDVARAALAERTFGKTKLPTPRCGGCHEQDTCDDCHGIRMPHPDNYADPRQHARAGAFDGREKLCYRCHTKQDCGECHTGLEGSHLPTWQRDHASRPRSEGDGYCLACHKTSNFCEVCHK